ncbi:MAG TPA: NADH-quinone oxidoreductase subunit J [Polyangia bacterium]|jgi:NADH-quinone oxidoreductase subunit J
MSRLLTALPLLLWAGTALAQPVPARAQLELGRPGMWSSPELWVFLVFAAGAIGGALFTITRKNVVSAVIALVGTFFCLAGVYVLLFAHFLAAMQVLVYAGAIMVLFIFVIMVLGRDDTEPWALRSVTTKVLGVGALLTAGFFLYRSVRVPVLPAVKEGLPPPGFGTVASFGELLFKDYLFPFEAVSLLLLLAVIGAVVIARGRHAPAVANAAEPVTPAVEAHPHKEAAR